MTSPLFSTPQPKADVLLLAAGFGARLKPITDTIPKPLIEVRGKTLIEWNLELIARSNLRRVIINLHHLGEKIQAYLSQSKFSDFEFIFVEEPEILGTGGAIRNIEPWLEHQVLLTVNSDIMIAPEFSLEALLRRHFEQSRAQQDMPLATLLLRTDADAEKYGALGVDQHGRVVEFLGKNYQGQVTQRGLMYTGIQALSREIFDFMPARGTHFSITQDVFPRVLEAGGWIQSLIFNGFWSDLGTPERIQRVENTE